MKRFFAPFLNDCRQTKAFFKGMKRGQALLLLLNFALLFGSFFSIFALSAQAKLNIVTIGFYLLFCLFSCAYVTMYGSYRFNSFCVFVILFNFLTFLSFAFNGFSNFSSRALLVSFASLFFFEFFAQDRKILLISFSCILMAGIAFLLYFAVAYRTAILHVNFSNRVGTLFGNQNDVARSLTLLGLIFCFYAFFRKYSLLFIPGFFCFYFILLTGSISNLLLFLLGFLVLLFLRLPVRARPFFIIALFLLVAVAFGILQLSSFSYFRNRLINIFSTFFVSSSSQEDSSAAGRFGLARDAFQLFLQRPLFGFGFDGFARLDTGYAFSHNNITELLCNFGLLCCGIYEFFLFKPVSTRHKSFLTPLVITFAIVLFLFQFVVVLYYDKIVYLILALFYSCDEVYENKTGGYGSPYV